MLTKEFEESRHLFRKFGLKRCAHVAIDLRQPPEASVSCIVLRLPKMSDGVMDSASWS
jgi:hypothetical protein